MNWKNTMNWELDGFYDMVAAIPRIAGLEAQGYEVHIHFNLSNPNPVVIFRRLHQNQVVPDIDSFHHELRRRSFPASAIPAGTFKLANSDPVYFSNGEGRFCWCSAISGEINYNNLPGHIYNYPMGFDGVCGASNGRGSIPVGTFKLASGPPIYYSNGQGHCCQYRDMRDFERKCEILGKPFAVIEYDDMPGQLQDYGMTLDGYCGGGNIYGSNPGGRYKI